MAYLIIALVSAVCVVHCHAQANLIDSAETVFAEGETSLSWDTGVIDDDDESCDRRVAEVEDRLDKVIKQVTAFMTVADEKYFSVRPIKILVKSVVRRDTYTVSEERCCGIGPIV